MHGDLRPPKFILRPDGSVAVVDYARSLHNTEPEDLEAERLDFLDDIADAQDDEFEMLEPSTQRAAASI
jgi:hypothetical protein